MSTVTQTSNLIDPTYPVAGQNNSSAGFRSNFANIQLSFNQTSVELTKLQKTHLVFLGDLTASSGQIDSAVAIGNADPNLNITLNLATVLSGGATLNTNTGDFQIIMDEKGRVINQIAVTRTISWGSFGAGQAITPPTSLGTGTGTLAWPALVFDNMGRLTQVTSQNVTYGLVDQVLTQGSLVVGNAAGLSSVLTSPSSGQAVLTRTGNGTTGLEWVDPSTLTPPVTEYYRIGFFFTTTPTASEVLALHAVTDAFTFPANFSTPDSKGSCETNPTASMTLKVQQNGSDIGTITISTAGAFTFATTSGTAQNILAGDVIKVLAPVTPDSTCANVAITLKGTI